MYLYLFLGFAFLCHEYFFNKKKKKKRLFFTSHDNLSKLRSQHLGSKEEYSSTLAAKTQRDIDEMNVAVGTKGNDVVKMLLLAVTDVNCDLVQTRSGQKVLS